MKNNKIMLIYLIITMVMLGVSDSLRGVFLPVFQDTLQLSATQASMIITFSYIGNLVFLMIGGYFLDNYKRKHVFMGVLGIWMGALFLFSVTQNYGCLLIGMLFSMGASTLMSTTVNLVSPIIFMTMPGIIINVLGFVQGIGTSGSQNLIGRYMNDFNSWQLVNSGLLVVGGVIMVMTFMLHIPDEKGQKGGKVSYKAIVQNKAFIYIVLIFGFYFIAEHGVMNWLVSYGTQHYDLSMAEASTYLSIFFGGLTIGRLVLSPFVDKLGVYKSIIAFGGFASVLYITGGVLGKDAMLLLSFSGIGFSIIYPTLVLMIRKFYPSHMIATATGTIISVATLFDIGFNMAFGRMIDTVGYGISFYVLPISMACFIGLYIFFYTKQVKTQKVEVVLN